MKSMPEKASAILAFALAVMSVLAVLTLHFPAYLSTPELRAKYDVDTLRWLLFAGMVLSTILAVRHLWKRQYQWLCGASLLLLTMAFLAGGHRVEIHDFQQGTPYIGLDWLVLDLLFSALLFIGIEKIWPLLQNQPVFRRGWQTDLTYFGVNHLLIGVVLLVTNALVHAFGPSPFSMMASTIEEVPFWLQILLIVLVADLLQYAVHRMFHQVPFLWRFHRIHHSVEVMDWLAGSRLHVFEVIATRVPILMAFALFGFSKAAVDVYVVIVGLHAVFNHANVRVNLGPLAWLRYILVFPAFHHWHHGSDRAAIDRNFAAHFAFIDHLFGTAVQSSQALPLKYGLSGEQLPDGFWAQQRSVFKK